jgi:ankyrin repeat protein
LTNTVDALVAKGGKLDILSASALGRKANVEALVNSDPSLARTNWDGTTPLHLAAYWDHKDVVELLIAKGANVNQLDSTGETAAERAAEAGHDEIVQVLRQHGAK